MSGAFSRLLLCLLLGAGFAASGCTKTPDPCAGYRESCLAVTVESGPADVYQLLVAVTDFGSTTPLTPRQMPEEPLVYPLRFAVRFRAFEDNVPPPEEVTIRVQALDQRNRVIGYVEKGVPFEARRTIPVSLRLGGPPDLSFPDEDLATPDLSAKDGGVGDGGADLAVGDGGSDLSVTDLGNRAEDMFGDLSRD